MTCLSGSRLRGPVLRTALGEDSLPGEHRAALQALLTRAVCLGKGPRASARLRPQQVSSGQQEHAQLTHSPAS